MTLRGPSRAADGDSSGRRLPVVGRRQTRCRHGNKKAGPIPAHHVSRFPRFLIFPPSTRIIEVLVMTSQNGVGTLWPLDEPGGSMAYWRCWAED
ncbi:hypothetical protein ANANG_G00297750, partial [Anguilla anguilla]